MKRLRSTLPFFVPAIVLCLSCACAGASGDGRDVVPPSRDVRVAEAVARQGYEYVARRPLATVALAEARGLAADVARDAIDKLADALDACATEQGRKAALSRGAARVVAEIDQDGHVQGTSVRVDSGVGAPNAVVCLVAPVRMMSFPPAHGAARGIAIEALWGAP